MFRQLEAEIGRMFEYARHSAVNRRSGQKLDIGTQIVDTLLAEITFTAWNSWLNGNSIANFQMGDICSNLFDGSSSLMTKNHGFAHYITANGAMSPIVDIRSTDSNAMSANQYL